MAAASNEAAYLADWVYHHLKFGFGPIEIHINNSTDNSREIADRIARLHDVVHVFEADPPPGVNPQNAALTDGRRRLRRQLRRTDYVMFMDIDEFWTPVDFACSIQQVLETAGWPQLASFNWFQMTNDVVPFGSALQQHLEGAHHRLVKTAFRAGMRIRQYTPHGVRPVWPHRHWNASGSRMGHSLRYNTDGPPDRFGPAFIAHRMFRSPVEYVAILGRGRPGSLDAAFKDNRCGYHVPVGEFAPDTLSLPAQALRRYHAGRRQFIDACDLAGQLETAQASVIARARRTLQAFLAMPKEERIKWRRMFRGLDLRRLQVELGLR